MEKKKQREMEAVSSVRANQEQSIGMLNSEETLWMRAREIYIENKKKI